jgi:NADPH-dependent 2,4-dienoyl-CoA reductase/sulfur reductase-like enzyme
MSSENRMIPAVRACIPLFATTPRTRQTHRTPEPCRLARNADLHVTLIDKHNYYQFQPLQYQVATGEAAASEVATGLRRWFRRRTNVDVKLGEVTAVDPTARRVTLASGQTVQGDFLVLAAGSQPNFFHTRAPSTATRCTRWRTPSGCAHGSWRCSRPPTGTPPCWTAAR